MVNNFKYFASSFLLLMIIFCNGLAQQKDDVYYTPAKKINSAKTDTVIRPVKNYHAIVSVDPSGFITMGPGFEYGRSNYSSGNKYDARAFGGEIGYKWVFKNGFCIEISDMIGKTQSKQIENTIGNSVVDDWSTDMLVYYMFSSKIGLAI
ncbi:MAG: hypothetical protein D4R64_02095 [Porphyromonadaceae bacterium]|nr:MAG: hypothetical protein D4R64_02095 [Porphyromonadaceae bacterium]